MTVWWRGSRIVSAVGAGVLILGGVSGVYAAQMDEPADLPLDLAAAADPGTWTRWNRDEVVIRFRVRMRGPGTDVRLGVVAAPAEALRAIECPAETRSSIPLPRSVAVCAVGDLPAAGGFVDVLLAAPARPQNITLTALAQMRAPGGEMVRQQAQSTVGSSEAVVRQARGPETLELARVPSEPRPVPPGPSSSAAAPQLPPSRDTSAGAGAQVSPRAGTETGDAVGTAPRTPLRGEEPTGILGDATDATGLSEAARAEQRTLMFLAAVLERAFAPTVSRQATPLPQGARPSPDGQAPAGAGAVAGSGLNTGAGTGAAAVPRTPMAPAAPARPGTPPGSGTPTGPRAQAKAPDFSGLQGQKSRNRPARSLHEGLRRGCKTAGRKAGQQREADGAGARRQGAGRPTGPGHPGAGQLGALPQGAGQLGLQPMPMGPGLPGGAQGMLGRPGARRPVVGPVVPGYPGAAQWPAGPQGVSGRPGAQRGVGGPMGPGHPGAGQPHVAMPQAPPFPMGVPGAGQMPGAVPGVGQMPGAVPGAGQMPGAVPGAGQMPGPANGSQLQLPPAGALPAAQAAAPQDPRPQGAPLPQDVDGPNTQVRPVSESSPLLTGVRGIPAVIAAVGALLGLLWLQRRIQRRRR